MQRSARILVIEDTEPGGKSLAEGLRRLGFASNGMTPAHIGNSIETGGHRPDIVLVDAKHADTSEAHTPTRKLLDLARAADIPTLLVGADAQMAESHAAEAWKEIVIGAVAPAYLAGRIAALMRLEAMRTELERRIQTSARYGVDAPPHVSRPQSVEDANVLVLGAGAEFGAVEDAISSSASIVGALSPTMALDYLRTHPFDCVIADMTIGFETVCEFAQDLRRDSRFFALPLLLIGAPGEPGWLEAAYASGVTEVVPVPVNSRSLRERIFAMVREDRFRDNMKQVYRYARHMATGDALTGLYARGFMMEHLTGLLNLPVAQRPLFSVGVFSIRNMAALNAEFGYAAGDRVIRHVGMAIANLVRGEDLAARYEGPRYTILFIGASSDEAQAAARRLMSFVNLTEFAVPGLSHPVRVELAGALAAPGPKDDAESIVHRAAAAVRT